MRTPWKESYDQPRQHIEKQRYYFANKGLSSQGYGFSSGHVWMQELNCEESWLPKNWCFWTVVFKRLLGLLRDSWDSWRLLRVPWTARRSNQSILKGISPGCSLVFFGRNGAKAETPVVWPLHARSWLIGKDSDAGRDWRQEEKGMTQDEMASLTRWTWVWVNSRRWFSSGLNWTEDSSVLES